MIAVIDVTKLSDEKLEELFIAVFDEVNTRRCTVICETCKKPYLGQRLGRSKFCSNVCRSKHNTAKLTLAEKATKMREYRARKRAERAA